MATAETHHILPPPSFATPPRVLIVRAPYYLDIADHLLAGAKAAVAAAGGSAEVIEVPGALEISPAISMASGYDGYVALGCIIRGETTHYETVCEESARGITLLGLDGRCIGNGILTVETMDQAMVRARDENKGGGAAEAALHLIAIKHRFRQKPSGGSFDDDASFQMAGG